MILRSQSENQVQPATTPISQTKAAPPKPMCRKISMTASNWKDNDDEQLLVLKNKFLSYFKNEPRDLQLDVNLSLVRKRDAFLFARTGFGKSRIPELFFLLFPKGLKPVVLILNPLDSLGDDQVQAKVKWGFTAINLNRATFTRQAGYDVKAGKYQFVYVSPEIFLNSTRFEELFFSKSFQDRLILKVVDEAHLIYEWGLAVSGKIKYQKSHTQPQDRTPFRASYGSLVDRFLATEDVPTLLMTATCTPQALEAILSSLKTSENDIDVHRGELTRPEIRFIRLDLPRNHKTWNVLHQFFPNKSAVSDSDLPPTLVYCLTQDGTFSAMESINEARGDIDDCNNGLSTCVRRYHSNTGPLDKAARVQDYANGLFSTMTCTTALGMGCDWNRVRRVIVVGESNPSNVLQMAGRAGRDGRPAVAFLIVDTAASRKKVSLSHIPDPNYITDDDRMHAMAITPVCLRVAFAVDLKYGYFPLQLDDQRYLNEKDRQFKAGMPECLCSNCHPNAAIGFINSQRTLSINNFDELILKKEYDSSMLTPINTPIIRTRTTPAPIKLNKLDIKMQLDFRFIRLVCNLQNSLQQIFKIEYPDGSLIEPSFFFSIDQLWVVSVNNHLFLDGTSLDEVFGSEPLPNSYLSILDQIKSWRASPDSKAILHPTPGEYRLYEQALQESLELERVRKKARESKSNSQGGAIEQDNVNQSASGQAFESSIQNQQPKRKLPGSQVQNNKRRAVGSGIPTY